MFVLLALLVHFLQAYGYGMPYLQREAAEIRKSSPDYVEPWKRLTTPAKPRLGGETVVIEGLSYPIEFDAPDPGASERAEEAWRGGRYEDAINILRSAVISEGRYNSALLYRLVFRLAQMNRFQEASKWAGASVSPGDDEGYRSLVIAILVENHRGSWETNFFSVSSVARYESQIPSRRLVSRYIPVALDERSQKSAAWIACAYVEALRGNEEEAIFAADRAWSYDPGNPIIACLLAKPLLFPVSNSTKRGRAAKILRSAMNRVKEPYYRWMVWDLLYRADPQLALEFPRPVDPR